MTRVRVDLLTKEYPPEIYGGAGVHVAELTKALRASIEVRSVDAAKGPSGRKSSAKRFRSTPAAACRT